jgi:hypothetical protein
LRDKEQDETPSRPIPPQNDTVLTEQDQAVLAQRLQSKWLRRMEWLIDQNLITPTEMTALARVLMQNGWQFDLAKIPKKLGEKLTSLVDTEEMDAEDGVLPFARKAQAGT